MTTSKKPFTSRTRKTPAAALQPSDLHDPDLNDRLTQEELDAIAGKIVAYLDIDDIVKRVNARCEPMVMGYAKGIMESLTSSILSRVDGAASGKQTPRSVTIRPVPGVETENENTLTINMGVTAEETTFIGLDEHGTRQLVNFDAGVRELLHNYIVSKLPDHNIPGKAFKGNVYING